MIEIRADDGRWRKQDGFSEVGQRLNDGGLEGVEPVEDANCIICQAPPVTMAMCNSWRESDGEPVLFTARVCEAHRGQWWWIPDTMQHAWDAATQRSWN